MKLLLIGFETLLSVATDGVRFGCPGADETADRGVEMSRLAEGGCVFTEEPSPEVNPLIVLVDALRGASRDEGVGRVFSFVGASSYGTFPLLFVLNHSITFFALLVLAAFPTTGLAAGGILPSWC